MSASATTTRAPAAASRRSAARHGLQRRRAASQCSGAPVRRSAGRPANCATFPSEPRPSTKISPPCTQRPVAGKGRAQERQRGVPGAHTGQQLWPDMPAQRRIDLLEQARRLSRGLLGAAASVPPPCAGHRQPATQPAGVGIHGHHVHAVARPERRPVPARAAPAWRGHAAQTAPTSRTRQSGHRPGSPASSETHSLSAASAAGLRATLH